MGGLLFDFRVDMYSRAFVYRSRTNAFLTALLPHGRSRPARPRGRGLWRRLTPRGHKRENRGPRRRHGHRPQARRRRRRLLNRSSKRPRRPRVACAHESARKRHHRRGRCRAHRQATAEAVRIRKASVGAVTLGYSRKTAVTGARRGRLQVRSFVSAMGCRY